MRFLALAVSMLLALGACGKKENATAGGDPTATIAPAKPQPEATGTDAMTETVDIEDSRTEGEGATLEETSTVTTSTSATAPVTATTPVTATANTPTTTR